MSVELVSVRTTDGVRLDGSWQRPSSPGRSEFPVDVMLLHHGVAGNFYGPSPFDDFAPWLAKAGCAAIRVNNRGHDPVSQASLNGQRVKIGSAYEIIDDCRADWDAWIEFAQKCGYERIGIWGHSLGATKSIYHAATENDYRVQCVIAASPPRFSYRHYAGTENWGEVKDIGSKFKETYNIAKGHIDDGHPEQLIQVEYPVPLLVSAATYADKYGPGAQYDILKHIPVISMPLLSVIGTTEPLGEFPFLGLPEEMQKLAAEFDHFTFEYVEGANHFYTDHRAEVWELTSRWLQGLASCGQLPRGKAAWP
jgi:dienelactone hydrolase